MGDTMSICDHRSFVLKTSSGKRWHFFLSPQQHIMYSQLDSQAETGSTVESVLLDPQPVKDFAATIDSRDNIHVLVYSTTNQLVYYQWNGVKWQRQTVEYLRTPAQDISFFTIMAYRDTVHIMYYIRSSVRRGTEFLIHYRGNGNKWTRQRVWTFTPDSLTAIESAFIDSLGNVHLLFSQQSDHQLSLQYCCFSPSFSSWTHPITIYKLGRECSEFYLYADPHHRLHVVWKEKESSNHIIKYLSIRYALQPEHDTLEAKIIHTSQDQPNHPTLLLLDQLYCLWEVKGDIYCAASQDGGNTWSSPQKIPHASSDNPTFFYYTSFERPDLPPTLRLWGINYKEVLDLSDPQSKSNAATAQKKEGQQLASYSQLEKKVAAMEQQLENITSSIYAFQEQLLQNNKAMYFLEAMVKKLSFQIEQLRIYSKQAFAYTDISQKEKKPALDKKQAYQTSSTPPPPMDGNSTHSTSPSSHSTFTDDNVSSPSEGKQLPQPRATASSPQEAGNGSQSGDVLQTTTMVQTTDSPNRITLGNVDIIINPQDEEE